MRVNNRRRLALALSLGGILAIVVSLKIFSSSEGVDILDDSPQARSKTETQPLSSTKMTLRSAATDTRKGELSKALAKRLETVDSIDGVVEAVKEWEASRCRLMYDEVSGSKSQLVYLVPRFSENEWEAVLAAASTLFPDTGEGFEAPLKKYEIFLGEKAITITESTGASHPDSIDVVALVKREGRIYFPDGGDGKKVVKGRSTTFSHHLDESKTDRYNHLFSIGEEGQ